MIKYLVIILDWSSSDEFENSAEKSQFCSRMEELDLKLGKVFVPRRFDDIMGFFK